MQSDRLDSSPSFLGREVVSPLSVSRSSQTPQKRTPSLLMAICPGCRSGRSSSSVGLPAVLRPDRRARLLPLRPYSQALGKLERAHEHDLGDAREMVAGRLIDPARAFAHFEEIEPEPFRLPGIDPANFRRRVEEAFASGI
jgi:hypothetical protein